MNNEMKERDSLNASSAFRVTTIDALWANPTTPTGVVIIDAVVEILNKSNTHSVEDVAAFFDVSSRHLSGALQLMLGLSLGQLIKEWRIRQVLALLDQRPDLSINEIAQRCGYSMENNMVLQFRKRFGTTPYIYRTGEVRRNGNYPMNESAASRRQLLDSAKQLKERR